MTRLITWPDPILSMRSAPIEDFGDPLSELITDLLTELYVIQGQALAAPQIGVLSRAFVMDVGWKTGQRAPRAFVNPEVLARSDRWVVSTETCHSLPGRPRRVARPDRVELRWQDSDGAPQRDWFDGIEAIAVQHDIDHLDGRTILDHPEPQ